MFQKSTLLLFFTFYTKYCTFFLQMCIKNCTFAQNFENCAMNDIPSFNGYFEQTIKDNWLLDALELGRF